METTQASVETCTSPAGHGGWRHIHWRRDTDPRGEDRTPTLRLADRTDERRWQAPHTRTTLAETGDWRRLERDLHDGVQNELVALIVKLALTEEDPQTPPALVKTLAELEARAQSVLESVRNVVQGLYPTVLADLGVEHALRAQAARAAIHVKVVGRAPRSTIDAEEAAYFSCCEAIQNAAKHAGRTARVELRLRHHGGTLHVRIADDGRGFDPARTRAGTGLRNIRERIQDADGRLRVASEPGRGTVLAFSLTWPERDERA